MRSCWLLQILLLLRHSYSFVRDFNKVLRNQVICPGRKHMMPAWSGEYGMILNDVAQGFRSGFVTIVGCPNVGKSTLMNRLVGDKVSIVSSKSQTTRHRVMGIMSRDDFQCIFYDTPGLLEAKYSLHAKMMESVGNALRSADDVVLVVVDITQVDASGELDQILSYLSLKGIEVVMALNKIDIFAQDIKQKIKKDIAINKVIHSWLRLYPNITVLPISASTGLGVDHLATNLKALLPLGPPLYHASTNTDKSPEFVAAEMIREKIFDLYGREIPYACEVQVITLKVIREGMFISAVVYVERKSQVGILIGKHGAAVARLVNHTKPELSKHFDKQVMLEVDIKHLEKWRSNNQQMKAFGYGV